MPEASRTFDMIELQRLAAQRRSFPPRRRAGLIIFLLIGFGTLISLFPFHSWAPPAYA